METETGAKLGPVGLRVAKNVKALRGRVTVRELSERLTELGRPILPSGITKIEQGKRRLDADDLAALAVALDATPNRLLLTANADDESVELTPEVATSTRDAWFWATGDVPLLMPGETHSWLRKAAWMTANRPHKPLKDMGMAAMSAKVTVLEPNRELLNLADS